MAAKGRRRGMAAKGFVFSIDAMLSLLVFMLMLVAAAFLSVQAEEGPYAKLQLSRMGKDAAALFDHQGLLSQANATAIYQAMNSTLPQSVGMHIQISTYYYDTGAFNLINIAEIGDAVPANSTVYGARRDFVSLRNGFATNYSIARVSLWQK